MRKTLRFSLLAGALAVGISLLTSTTASAQGFGYGGYGGSQPRGNFHGGFGGYGNGPAYHPPSVHYDYRYHPTRLHWTPLRGLHTHGHYDRVPHYTPGHFDRRHNGHIDLNPYFHHR